MWLKIKINLKIQILKNIPNKHIFFVRELPSSIGRGEKEKKLIFHSLFC